MWPSFIGVSSHAHKTLSVKLLRDGLPMYSTGGNYDVVASSNEAYGGARMPSEPAEGTRPTFVSTCWTIIRPYAPDICRKSKVVAMMAIAHATSLRISDVDGIIRLG